MAVPKMLVALEEVQTAPEISVNQHHGIVTGLDELKL